MRVDGDVAFDDARYGRSRVIAVGGIGTTGNGVRFRDLDVTLDPVQVGMASGVRADRFRSPARCAVCTAQRRVERQMVVRADLTHNDAAPLAHRGQHDHAAR
jgi:hypothetical protein